MLDALIDTDDVPRRERHDHWRSMMRETFAIDYRFPLGRHDWFRARCSAGDLGPVRLAVISAAGGAAPSAGEARRRPSYSGQADAYEIKYSMSGDRLVMAQDGREADLRPGDFAVSDLTRPASVAGTGTAPTRVISLMVPRALLPLPPATVGRLTAVRMPGRDGTGALVSALLRRIVRDADAYDPAEAVRISAAVLELIAATMTARTGAEPTVTPGSDRGSLLRRVYAYMEENLRDPGLCPRTIAAAHHISLRSLYNLFADEEHTVAEWIRRRRLERCRGDLMDPALLDLPVAAIAVRWGFADAAHFSRLFRAVHGTPPSEFRRLRLQVR